MNGIALLLSLKITRVKTKIKGKFFCLKTFKKVCFYFFIIKVILSLNGDSYKSLYNFNSNKSNRILYVGGVKQSHSNLILPDFKGIISHFKLNDKKLDLFSDSHEKKNINVFNTCHNVNCKNNGICITSQNDLGFRCKCFESYEGVFCEKKNLESYFWSRKTTRIVN